MPVSDAILDALDLSKLRLPPSPRVIRLEVEDYEDADGEPALRILAVIDEATNLDEVKGRDVGDLKFAIHESLLQHGVTLFPYIFLAKPSELEEDEED